MVVPLILLCLSSAVAGVALFQSGFALSDMMLLSLVMVLASLILLFRAMPKLRRGKARSENWILVDGSNVLFWKAEQPHLSTVREVLNTLTARGFMPGVMFDANIGYKIGNRYLDDLELAQMLNLPEAQVLVVPKGTPADKYLLQAAKSFGVQVVTNDRFRDWAQDHPEVGKAGFLIRGGYTGNTLWLDEAALTHRSAA